MSEEIALLRRRLERERLARKQAELILEEKSRELFSKGEDLESALKKEREVRKELEVTKISADDAREYAESIINTVREPLIALDQDLRVVTASRSFYDFFKVNPEETVGHLIYDLGNKQWDIPRLRELLETILPQKATFDNYEAEHEFATIGRRIMLLNARQIQHVSGKERIILLAIEDITERKQAEEAIKQNEVFLNTLLSSIPIPIFYKDRDGRYTGFNRAYENFFGVTKEKLIGKTVFDISPPELAKIYHAKDNDLLESGVEQEYESQVKNTLGVTRDVIFNKAVFTDSKGAVKGLIGAIRDITERKKNDELIKILNEQQQIILDASPAMIFYKDKENRFIRVNEALARANGMSKEEMEGKTCWDIFPREEAEIYWQNDKEVMADGKPSLHIIEEMKTPKGTMWVQTDKIPYRNPKGEIIGIIGFTLDITERKLSESYREMSTEILQILSKPSSLHDSIQSILTVLKIRTGCDAVGIRLRDGDDFPYFAQNGFSNDFLLKENTLIERDPNGGLCRDKDGNVNLECTCGLVISGKTDPSNPLFTRGGSFWINDSLPLLDLPSDQDPRLHPRNTCIHQGYASVALVPIRIKDKIMGLMQFNDHRKYCFSLAVIEQIEGIAANIGEALLRKQAEDALHESEERYRTLVENARDIIFKTDETGHYTFVNSAAMHITGYGENEIIGKHFKMLVRPDMFKAVITFFMSQYENRVQNTYLEFPILTKDGREIWLGQNIHLLVEDDHLIGFQAVARDISERRQLEEDLKKRETMLNEMGTIAKVGGWEFDAETYKQVWTKEVYRIHEVDESFEPTVEKGIEFYTPSSRPVIERAIQRAIDYGDPFDVELEIITAKGNHRWVHASGKVDPARGTKKIVSGTFQDVTERRRAEEKIRHMAFHDSLTGLPNRKLFSDRLHIAFAQARRNQKKVGIAMLDLDNFKGVNDTLGHDVGDLLLKEIAERLRSTLRQADTIARFGGDEFALILPEMSVRENAIQLAQKIIDIFCKPFLLDTHKLAVTVSIGIAVYPDDERDEDMLLKYADIAMYQAKQGGRAQYQLYKKIEK